MSSGVWGVGLCFFHVRTPSVFVEYFLRKQSLQFEHLNSNLPTPCGPFETEPYDRPRPADNAVRRWAGLGAVDTEDLRRVSLQRRVGLRRLGLQQNADAACRSPGENYGMLSTVWREGLFCSVRRATYLPGRFPYTRRVFLPDTLSQSLAYIPITLRHTAPRQQVWLSRCLCSYPLFAAIAPALSLFAVDCTLRSQHYVTRAEHVCLPHSSTEPQPPHTFFRHWMDIDVNFLLAQQVYGVSKLKRYSVYESWENTPKQRDEMLTYNRMKGLKRCRLHYW